MSCLKRVCCIIVLGRSSSSCKHTQPHGYGSKNQNAHQTPIRLASIFLDKRLTFVDPLRPTVDQPSR